MSNSHVLRRTLGRAALAVALAGVAIGSSGCYSSVKGAAPATTAVVAIGAPTAAEEAEMQSGGGMHGTQPVAQPTAPASQPAAKPATKAKTSTLSARGGTIVQKSCMQAKCHDSKLLSYRAPAATVKKKVMSMAPKSNLTAGQQAAVVAYFAK